MGDAVPCDGRMVMSRGERTVIRCGDDGRGTECSCDEWLQRNCDIFW